MNKALVTILICSLTSLVSCSLSNSGKKDLANYTLQATDKCIRLPLDEWTKELRYPQQITDDKDGTNYLVFQNYRYPDLLFYNKETGKLKKRITMPYQGSDAVRPFSSFVLRKMDEIYLIDNDIQGITLINGKGKPIQYIPTISTDNQRVVCESGNFDIIGDSIYFGLHVNAEPPIYEQLKKSPFCAIFDPKTLHFTTLPLSYFDVTHDETDENNPYDIYFISRCYNKNQNKFVYAFTEIEYIYETDMAHASIRKIKAKSKYLSSRDVKKVKFGTVSDRTERIKKELARGKYNKIYYDPYRRVYYRIVLPPSDIPENVDLINFSLNGGHAFSIMILDEDFNVIDEVLLPKDTYIPKPMFIDEDGLYICEHHILNPNYSDDVCLFRRFELVSKK